MKKLIDINRPPIKDNIEYPYAFFKSPEDSYAEFEVESEYGSQTLPNKIPIESHKYRFEGNFKSLPYVGFVIGRDALVSYTHYKVNVNFCFQDTSLSLSKYFFNFYEEGIEDFPHTNDIVIQSDSPENIVPVSWNFIIDLKSSEKYYLGVKCSPLATPSKILISNVSLLVEKL